MIKIRRGGEAELAANVMVVVLGTNAATICSREAIPRIACFGGCRMMPDYDDQFDTRTLGHSRLRQNRQRFCQSRECSGWQRVASGGCAGRESGTELCGGARRGPRLDDIFGNMKALDWWRSEIGLGYPSDTTH